MTLLPIHARLYSDPYSRRIPGFGLPDIIRRVCRASAERISERHQSCEYASSSLAIAVMDSTAPTWLASDKALLATVAIGEAGERLVLEAVAKAMQHRDRGLATHADPMRSADGDLSDGYATLVDGTVVAACGLTEQQNAYEAGHFALGLNLLVRNALGDWRTRHPSNRFLADNDRPSSQISDVMFMPLVCDIEIDG